ncbi:unnamed protein product (macronuclear) [Paramecium tetraurelia]|uniref:Chromosome undetermined scaffold_1, whole genome shotgun sequence n=1 Tax=Paramecium tetraurelia TaxID=5888 RepID=Q6BFW3_PARTE|nr:WD-40 repeat protein [Paramecium tetraurelia strain d4-2]XP_001423219.1 uncharacterized protein GSPATT00000256001 [Paramecium tetraurelia]CAH03457.1 WD-40 repeat protein, putative [Paramecium tetraurelia]CAK55821.1 unnamed protein product [Paramecium tetraurelia]|eukprot:XP_001423219.1 hypothetical protein (macronuclear) [Paramecium tetraurelia strain d4-2]
MIIPEKFSGLDLSSIKPIMNQNLIVANKYNYRIYSIPDLKYILDGIIFNQKIRAMYCQNEFMYVGCGKKVYTIKRNVIDEKEYDDKIEQILVFHPIKIIATKHKLHINDNVMSFQGIKGILHIPTYLNKILLYTSQYIKIINIVSLSIVTTIFQQSIFNKQEQTIHLIKETQALDIVAIATQNPSEIIFFNLMTYEVITQYELGLSQIKDIQFNKSGSIPIMSVVQDKSLILYNLNSQELIYTFKHEHLIDWVLFLANNNLVIGSQQGNSIQQYTIEEHKMMQLIRERQGVKQNIEQCHFYGQLGEPQINYVAITKDEILYQSIVNQNLTAIKQGQIRNFSFSTLRENDWANMLTTNSSNYVEFWNTYQKKLTTKVNGLTSHERILQTFVSKCGNYGFIANLNKIHKFIMQSGFYQMSYNLQSNFLQMYIDPSNIFLIVAEEGQIEQLDFVSGQNLKTLMIESNVTKIIGSQSTQIAVLSLQNHKILAIDYSAMKIIRSFEGHNEKILDMAMTINNQHFISTSLDKKIKIWNLIYGNLVQEISINKALISIDVSENQLIGVFLNSRQVNVWMSNLNNPQQIAKAKLKCHINFHSDLSIKSKDYRSILYGNQIKLAQKMEEEKDSKEKLLINDSSNNKEFISFTTLEEGRWVPIQNIDQIRERNRVKLADADVKMPFFLDFRNTDVEKQNMLNEIKEQVKEKTKILKQKKDHYLAELKSEFEVLVEQEDVKLINLIKTLSPSSYDYELRSILMGKPQNQIKIFRIFEESLQTTTDLDLKVTYLMRFIEVAREDIDLSLDEELKQTLLKIIQILESQWDKLDDTRSYIECVIDYSKTII